MKRQLWIMPIVALYSGLFGQRLAFLAEPNAAAEVISGDPRVLQIEIFLPKSEGVQIGPNIRFDPDKRAIFTQFQPGDVTTTDFTLKNADSAIKVIATLRGDVPPYIVDFEQSASPVPPPTNPVSHQQVEFPTGKLTRVRLFDLFDVQGFYGNPQQKRP
jgi:hypothetical protein